jgi:hypothetical protein
LHFDARAPGVPRRFMLNCLTPADRMDGNHDKNVFVDWTEGARPSSAMARGSSRKRREVEDEALFRCPAERELTADQFGVKAAARQQRGKARQNQARISQWGDIPKFPFRNLKPSQCGNCWSRNDVNGSVSTSTAIGAQARFSTTDRNQKVPPSM